jgi:predicted DNA-binding transcriptional regulator AlpA
MAADKQYQPDDHLTRVQLAKVLGTTTRTLDRWAATGEGPPRVRLPGGRVRYRWGDVQEWLRERREGG